MAASLIVEAAQGGRAAAQELLDAASEKRPRPIVRPPIDKDRAFEWLTKCVEERTRILSFHFKSRPLFDSLRSDPRYVDLLRRMNLEP